jgi:hypothetical protein
MAVCPYTVCTSRSGRTPFDTRTFAWLPRNILAQKRSSSLSAQRVHGFHRLGRGGLAVAPAARRGSAACICDTRPLPDAGPSPFSCPRNAGRLQSSWLREGISHPLFARLHEGNGSDSLAEQVFRPHLLIGIGFRLRGLVYLVESRPKGTCPCGRGISTAGSFTNAEPFRPQPANVWAPDWKTIKKR